MKTIVKLSGLISLILVLMLSPVSCKKEGATKMTVRMTDAPGLYSEVNVEITGLQAHYDSKGWVNLDVNEGIYNLIELQNDVAVVLVDHAAIPTGKVTQMRLMIGDNNTVVDATGSHPLTVHSGSESGLKINVGRTIIPFRDIDILLDFDANASVVAEGNGSYALKPVIKVKSVAFH